MFMKFLTEMMLQATYSANFKEKNPQCAGCMYVNELIFDERIYKNVVSKRFCPSCPKYGGDDDASKAER